MPIYAYRCTSCGCEEDVRQRLADAPLTQCPRCHQDTFIKQVSAVGFQLKGSGYYVTDFRDNKITTQANSSAPTTQDDTPNKASSNSSESASQPSPKSPSRTAEKTAVAANDAS